MLMAISLDELRTSLDGMQLPGGELRIEAYEAAIGDQAWHADPDPDGFAHPMWFIVASVRCMGISVEELCVLAHQGESDTLLFGSCTVVQDQPLRVGATYSATAAVTGVDSRQTRDGSRLDTIAVAVRLREASGDDVG